MNRFKIFIVFAMTLLLTACSNVGKPASFEGSTISNNINSTPKPTANITPEPISQKEKIYLLSSWEIYYTDDGDEISWKCLYYYDEYGNCIEKRTYNYSKDYYDSIEYQYDDNNEVIKETTIFRDENGESNDNSESVNYYSYTYDDNNNVVKKTETDGSDYEGITYYRYDDNNNLIMSYDDYSLTKYYYDANQRLLSEENYITVGYDFFIIDEEGNLDYSSFEDFGYLLDKIDYDTHRNITHELMYECDYDYFEDEVFYELQSENKYVYEYEGDLIKTKKSYYGIEDGYDENEPFYVDTYEYDDNYCKVKEVEVDSSGNPNRYDVFEYVEIEVLKD